MHYIVQTRGGHKYTELFEAVARVGHFTRLSVAVAYATVGGVRTLEQTLSQHLGKAWATMQKRWLVGIDWCRSDPPALARLATLSHSDVRVPNGDALLATPGSGCRPRDTFHPKLFIFCGPRARGVVCGSGNLSANGLLRGCECGSIVHTGGRQATDEGVRQQTKALLSWFDTAWRQVTVYGTIRSKYEEVCHRAVRAHATVPTEDDTEPSDDTTTTRRAALTKEQIRQLRTFNNFWIDAGPLGANLGRGIPGNQLDMKRFTRAFFGAPIANIPPNREIDQITLVWDGTRHADRTLKFGDNHMDKLNVPPAGSRGPLFYKGKTLLFSRRPDGSFDFNPGDKQQRRTWRASSKRTGVVVRLSAEREWGLF